MQLTVELRPHETGEVVSATQNEPASVAMLQGMTDGSMRTPQSLQSAPKAAREYSAPGPPSSQTFVK